MEPSSCNETLQRVLGKLIIEDFSFFFGNLRIQKRITLKCNVPSIKHFANLILCFVRKKAGLTPNFKVRIYKKYYTKKKVFIVFRRMVPSTSSLLKW